MMAKQPAERLSPFAAEEVAVVEVILRRFAANPPVKVEVEVTGPETVRKPASDEVAVEVPVT